MTASLHYTPKYAQKIAFPSVAIPLAAIADQYIVENIKHTPFIIITRPSNNILTFFILFVNTYNYIFSYDYL